MKKTLETLGGGKVKGPGGPAVGGDDFLGRANTVITNFRELLKMGLELRGGQGIQESKEKDQVEIQKDSPKQLNQPNYFEMFANSPYGKMTVGQLIKQLDQVTIKELWGMINNARPKQ